MTKETFLRKVTELYRVGNYADSDSPEREAWTKPEMAGEACCAALDTMLHNMVEAGVLSADELQRFHDTL